MQNRRSVTGILLVFGLVLNLLAGAASAAFSDQAEITHAEQVGMLTDLGILNGYGDGSFRPTGKITRAEFSKMVYVVKNGVDDRGGVLQNVASKFQDVNGHWARGYINYAERAGIIQGRSAVRFDPDAPITAFEAAKMSLLLLGYDAHREELIGRNWEANTAGLAVEKGVLRGYDGDPAAYADRQTASLILYNALFAKTVYYSQATQSAHDERVTLGEKEMQLAVIEGVAVANAHNSLADGVLAAQGKTVLRRSYGGDIAVPQAASDLLLGRAVRAYVKLRRIPAAGTAVTAADIAQVYGAIRENEEKNTVVMRSNADVTYRDNATAIEYEDDNGKTVSVPAHHFYSNYSKSAARSAGLGERTNETILFISNDAHPSSVEFILKIPMEYTQVTYYNYKNQQLRLSNGQKLYFEELTMPEGLAVGEPGAGLPAGWKDGSRPGGLLYRQPYRDQRQPSEYQRNLL